MPGLRLELRDVVVENVVFLSGEGGTAVSVKLLYACNELHTFKESGPLFHELSMLKDNNADAIVQASEVLAGW